MLILHLRRSGPLMRGFDILLTAHLHLGKEADQFTLHPIEHFTEHLEGFAFVFLFRVLLRIAAQTDTLPQVIQCSQMLPPVHIKKLEQSVTTLENQKRQLDDQLEEERRTNSEALEATREILQSKLDQDLETQANNMNALLEDERSAGRQHRKEFEENSQQSALL